MRERKQFLAGLQKRTDKQLGTDSRSPRITVAQRKSDETIITEIMRGEITYGPKISGGA